MRNKEKRLHRIVAKNCNNFILAIGLLRAYLKRKIVKILET